MRWKLSAFLVAAAIALPCARAAAQCSRVVRDGELPLEVDTPRGNHLSYSYDLERERFYVVATRGPAPGVAPRRGPYGLTRGCAPATLEWESDEFVVLTAGCGSFCFTALALAVSADGPEPQSAMRPFAFDAARNLLAYYAEPDVISVRNLATRREQAIPTPDHCPSWSGTCFYGLSFTSNGLEYVWKFWQPLPGGEFRYFPDERVVVPLDPALTAPQ